MRPGLPLCLDGDFQMAKENEKSKAQHFYITRRPRPGSVGNIYLYNLFLRIIIFIIIHFVNGICNIYQIKKGWFGAFADARGGRADCPPPAA